MGQLAFPNWSSKLRLGSEGSSWRKAAIQLDQGVSGGQQATLEMKKAGARVTRMPGSTTVAPMRASFQCTPGSRRADCNWVAQVRPKSLQPN
jgi:hypothetical protein